MSMIHASLALFILAIYICSSFALEQKNSLVTFTVDLDGKESDIEIMLFDDVVPKTVASFIGNCLKDKNGYLGTKFHRVIDGFMIQGGDIDHLDGRGGKGFLKAKFEDENFDKQHSEPGILSMANAGADTNGSQFFITVAKTAWLDGLHVVFGKVINGYDVVEKISKVTTDRNSKPLKDIKIVKIRVKSTQTNSLWREGLNRHSLANHPNIIKDDL